MLRDLHNVHAGKRGFIVCNGPSLKATDLDRLADAHEITFACNKIDKIFPKTRWRPTYYTVMDNDLQFTLADAASNIPAVCKFFRTISYLKTREVKGQCVFLHTDGNRKLLETPKFSEDIEQVLYTIGTVTYAMLQIAVYMGIRDIYIIGCDNSYSKNVLRDGTLVETGQNSYFVGSAPSDNAVAVSVWEMNVAYEYARQYGDAHCIHIYNATRGGYLEAFPRVDFDSLFPRQ